VAQEGLEIASAKFERAVYDGTNDVSVTSPLLKPVLPVFGFPYQPLNSSPGERNIDRLTHDTVTLLTA